VSSNAPWKQYKILVLEKRNNTFDLVVTAIGIVGCAKIKIRSTPLVNNPVY
jgi:hypothetical protein